VPGAKDKLNDNRASHPAISDQFLHAWANCLRPSYKYQLTQTPNKNEAAERAFMACKSEEDDFRSSEAPNGELLFPHLKSQVKVVIIYF
jgi:hypothetical protein